MKELSFFNPFWALLSYFQEFNCYYLSHQFVGNYQCWQTDGSSAFITANSSLFERVHFDRLMWTLTFWKFWNQHIKKSKIELNESWFWIMITYQIVENQTLTATKPEDFKTDHIKVEWEADDSFFYFDTACPLTDGRWRTRIRWQFHKRHGEDRPPWKSQIILWSRALPWQHLYLYYLFKCWKILVSHL